MQLRGHQICPKCGKILTGSASKGRIERYYYYHCTSACGARFKSEIANELFLKELRKLIPKPGMTEVYKIVLQGGFITTTAPRGMNSKKKTSKNTSASANTEKMPNTG